MHGYAPWCGDGRFARPAEHQWSTAVANVPLVPLASQKYCGPKYGPESTIIL
jgi:hypothetical protein